MKVIYLLITDIISAKSTVFRRRRRLQIPKRISPTSTTHHFPTLVNGKAPSLRAEIFQLLKLGITTSTKAHSWHNSSSRGEWPSGLYSFRQVTEVKLGRVRSDFGWMTSVA